VQAIVSAICARAGHKLCACFLSTSRFRCWARAGGAPRESGLRPFGLYVEGILTINEARRLAARLTEASANRPMTLANAGFVPLPE
jgi:hypothetical protein